MKERIGPGEKIMKMKKRRLRFGIPQGNTLGPIGFYFDRFPEPVDEFH
jgi:hypothetical protein